MENRRFPAFFFFFFEENFSSSTFKLRALGCAAREISGPHGVRCNSGFLKFLVPKGSKRRRERWTKGPRRSFTCKRVTLARVILRFNYPLRSSTLSTGWRRSVFFLFSFFSPSRFFFSHTLVSRHREPLRPGSQPDHGPVLCLYIGCLNRTACANLTWTRRQGRSSLSQHCQGPSVTPSYFRVFCKTNRPLVYRSRTPGGINRESPWRVSMPDDLPYAKYNPVEFNWIGRSFITAARKN